jgi:PIN like domain
MTLAERYGRPADESVTDVEWLEEAGRRDWVVMKDERIRRRAAEKEVLLTARVRCFVITRGIMSRANAQRFLANLAAMERACAEPGPFIYAVHERQLERLNLG